MFRRSLGGFGVGLRGFRLCSSGFDRFLRVVAPSRCASSIFIMVHVLLSHPRCARGSPSVLYECLLKFCFTYTFLCFTSDAHEARRPSFCNALDKFAAASMLAL